MKDMSVLFSTFSAAEMIRALSWTLIHSLWQGVLLSIIAAIIIFATRHTKPQVRYNLLALALVSFMLTAVITFSVQVTKAGQRIDPITAESSFQQSKTAEMFRPVMLESKLSTVNTAVAFVDANAPLIVMLWFVIITIQFIRLTAGMYSVHRFKHTQVSGAGEYWNQRFGELKIKLHISKKVELLQSALVQMPAALGYLKPVILFPAGMLTSLPPDEVEAVLLHELAHIRRKDFLVNLLQQLVEIVFFFNPAVLWVSSLIKSERENCCDEIAVQQTCSKQNYINALLSFEAFTLPPAAALANGFNGEKDHLLNRIKRIIYNNNKTLNNMEKKFLAAGIIVGSLVIFSFTTNKAQQTATGKGTLNEQKSPAVSKENSPAEALQTDTVPAPGNEKDNRINGTINTMQNGKRYKMVTEDNVVKELYVDGKKITEEKMDSYKDLTNKLLQQAKLDLEQSQKEMEDSKKEMAKSQIEMEDSKKELALSQIEIEQSSKELEHSKKEMEDASRQMVVDQQQAKKDMEQSKLDMEQSKKEMALAKIELEKSQEEMKEDSRRAKLDMEQSSRDMLQAKKDMEQAAKDQQTAKKDEEESRLLQENIIKDFISENIIKNKSELKNYILSNEELIVNGVKQPEDVFKTFKSKYVKSKHFTIMYNNQ